MSKSTSDKGISESQSSFICEDENFDRHPCNAPAFMSAVVRRQYLQQMIKNFPTKMQNRIVALKNIQLDQLKYEAEFYEDVYNLERKYNEKYQPLFEKRREIIVGKFEPPTETKRWKEDGSKNLEEIEIFSKKDSLLKFPTYEEEVNGIPDFWLTIFRNTELLCEMVQDHDEPIFKKLIDIKIKYENENEHSYILEFYFDKNEYFTNTVLTKQYFLKSSIDDEFPFAFEGPEIFKCKGCNINWLKGMNLTIKTIHKKQKHKERGVVRSITKQVPNDSFFNFFSPPEVLGDKEELDEESQGILATDFEIGHFLRARIIPKAVLYFTGDIVDDGDDEVEYGEEEEEEDQFLEEENAGSQLNITSKKETPNECPNQ